MTYQIQINNSFSEDFLKIIQSLKNVGMVESCKASESLALEGSAIGENDFLRILKEREQEIQDGNFLTPEELVKFLKLWRNFK